VNEARVTLEPLRDGDSSLLFEWINDRELVELSSAYEPVGEAAHRAWFDSIRDREDVVIFGIREEPLDQLVGSCQLLDIDRRHGTAKLQIRIGDQAARDRGLGTAAVGQLLRHAFEELGLHRVELDVFATNPRAIAAYEKAGFSREGVRREAVEIGGQRIDVIVMAILRRDWAR
jgi:RimJ/RimL family protein N-acetyltransferase